MMACTKIDNLIDKFNAFTEKPVKFLTAQKEIKDDIKHFVKSLYDYTKAQESGGKKNKGALCELIVDEFDEEQIWQQIDLQNAERWDQLVWEVANCMSVKNNLIFPIKVSKDIESNETNENDVQDEDSISNEEQLLSEKENLLSDTETTVQYKIKTKSNGAKSKPSIVDDKFFKLNDMEQFLLKVEKNEGKGKASMESDEESVDYFEDIDDEEDDDMEKDMMYSDFFDQDEVAENGEGSGHQNEDVSESDQDSDENEPENNKKDKKVHFAQPSSDESEDSDEPNIYNNISGEKKSEFELQQQRLKQQIERLEGRTLKEAPWQLKGEVDANKRPQNSLLQEVVDFDLTSRPAPIITEQTTVTLEDLIRQRIKDKAWDDVEKKEKPVDDQLAFHKKEVLDHSKSKLSLAQVYEAEYLKQKQAMSGDVEVEKEPESHKEIREAMSQLFSKLDALCHYHYTPKAAQAEVKIVTNTPAISMEEVAPVATSDATLLAPEEVKKKQRGELMSKEERSKTDKNRERRKKKKFQQKKGKVDSVTEHRNTKKGMEAADKSVKTSKAFFQQLNDESNSIIKKKNVKKH